MSKNLVRNANIGRSSRTRRMLRHAGLGFRYAHHHTRTHLLLRKDCPDPRPVHAPPRGKVIAISRGWRDRRLKPASRYVEIRSKSPLQATSLKAVGIPNRKQLTSYPSPRV